MKCTVLENHLVDVLSSNLDNNSSCDSKIVDNHVEDIPSFARAFTHLLFGSAQLPTMLGKFFFNVIKDVLLTIQIVSCIRRVSLLSKKRVGHELDLFVVCGPVYEYA